MLCWPVLYAFLRLVTRPRVLGVHAVTVTRGWSVVHAYAAHPAVRLVTAGAGHLAIAAELAATPGLRSEDVPDVEIAALAIEHGLALATHDQGFRRFASLRVVDPLAGLIAKDSPGWRPIRCPRSPVASAPTSGKSVSP